MQDTLDASTNLSVKRHKQQEDAPNNISVVWEFADLGNEKEPIYFVPPNIIYCNTSNDSGQVCYAEKSALRSNMDKDAPIFSTDCSGNGFGAHVQTKP